MLPLSHVTMHMVMSWTNVSFFQGTEMGNRGRTHCCVVIAYSGGTCEERMPAPEIFNPREGKCLKVLVPWGPQERAAGTLRSAPGPLYGTHVPTTSPCPIIRALLIMLCKWWEMDFTFPPARLHTALHLLSPFKNTESSEKGNGSFLFVRQQSWHRPVKQSSWAVICKAALCCLIPPPPRLFTRHTQTSARLKTSYFLIRQNLSAWVMKMLQHLLTSHQINLELRPQHLVLIHISGW